MRPLLGRGFLPEEEKVGGDDRVVILSYGYWQRRFAGDPRIVGRQIQLSGQPYTVVGITPKEFRIERDVDLYAPARADTTLPRRAEFLDVYRAPQARRDRAAGATPTSQPWNATSPSSIRRRTRRFAAR